MEYLLNLNLNHYCIIGQLPEAIVLPHSDTAKFGNGTALYCIKLFF